MSQNIISLDKKTTYSEQDIIKGIIEDNDMLIRFLYKKFYPGIKTMVRSFHNLRFDPDDIFQEGLTRAIINIKNGKFQGRSSFYTYLNSICHHICLQELKSVQGNYPVMENIPDDSGINDNDQDAIVLLLKMKEKMDQSCREIIDVRFGLGLEHVLDDEQLGHHQNLKFEEIGKILGIEPDNARQRFKRCMEKLRQTLFSNPAWSDNI
jgi:RNA polymerase sigma factor (sigma-70 family)